MPAFLSRSCATRTRCGLLLLVFVAACGAAQSGDAPAADEAPAEAEPKDASAASKPQRVRDAGSEPGPALDAGSTSAPRMRDGAAQVAADAGELPCAVEQIVRRHCQECHATEPLFGAPMALVSASDFQAAAHSNPARKVYELAAERVRDTDSPMPPLQAQPLSADELSTLGAWLEGGAREDASPEPCVPAGEPPSDAGMMPAQTDRSDQTCYELPAHGNSQAGDSSPYMIPTGESYACFYFKTPWITPTLSVSFESKLDHPAPLHHWFLYAMPSDHPDGTVESCLPLHFDQPTMLAGWAPGGQDFVLPPDVGEENPAPGSTLMVEWHYFNNANSALADRSAVRICTVPQDERPHVASITWLGTEDIGGLIGMPPGQKSSYSGVCNPGRMGLSAQDSIHLLYATPHMHQYGRHTQITIQRATGGSDTVLDQPFSDRQQIFYPIDADVLPGDSIKTTCSYENTSDRNIPWGSPFGDGEMCYAFVLHYPAHSLDNGASSVLGASNTCW